MIIRHLSLSRPTGLAVATATVCAAVCAGSAITAVPAHAVAAPRLAAAPTTAARTVAAPTTAATTVTRYVAWPQANYRTGPGTAYRIAGSLWQGAKVTGSVTSNGWLKMTNGYYISGAVLTTTAPTTVTRYVTSSVANYRTGPSTGYGSVGTYARGTKVIATATAGGWLRIKANGYYISGVVLTATPISTATPVTQHVAVRWGDVYTEPTTSSTRIDYAPLGGVVKGTVSAGWMKLGANRYIPMSQLTNNSHTYNGANGRLDPATLCSVPIPGKEHRFVRCGGASAGLKALNVAFRASFGHDLDVDECYRTYATQVFYRAERSTLAALPGYSNHGLARACDLDGDAARYGFGTAREQWMVKNGPKYGWVRPAFMDKGGSKPEFWHFEYLG